MKLLQYSESSLNSSFKASVSGACLVFYSHPSFHLGEGLDPKINTKGYQSSTEQKAGLSWNDTTVYLVLHRGTWHIGLSQ